MKVQRQIPVGAYESAGFAGRQQQLIRETVVPYQYSVLWDRAADTEKSHVAANFINAGRALRGEDPGDGFYGMVFQDSDAAKWLEAASYALVNHPDPALERQVDEMISLVAGAQDKDGYLDTFFTVKDRDRRWTNLLEAHELYCAGHMIEAGCAHYESTGKTALLEVVRKNAEHIYRRFVEEGTEGIPGHPEIELALLRLFRVTGDARFLELSRAFIDRRGTDPEIFAREAEKRNWSVWNSNPRENIYNQSHAPVRQQSDAVGHAVRAVYLYTGMADLASETGDRELLDACRRLWDSIVRRRMYVTGGIGSTGILEAFTEDYDLPPDTAYAETCASVGLIFFASRMLENEIRGEYADVMELALYNTVLAGMQLDGKRFFYVNPLETDPGITGKARTHAHVLPVRPRWYACACCPPNVARLIGSLGKYAYGENDDTAFCHLFAAGRVRFSCGLTLDCETDYPYDLTVRYTVSGNGKLAVRIPGWSRTFTLTENGKAVSPVPDNGYVTLDVRGTSQLVFTFDGTPAFIRSSLKVPRLAGMTALRRGPLVYCFEGADNSSVRSLRIDRSAPVEVSPFRPDLLGGTVTLTVGAQRMSDCDSLYSEEAETLTPCMAVAVPYYTWGNRGENEMRVWMNTADH